MNYPAPAMDQNLANVPAGESQNGSPSVHPVSSERITKSVQSMPTRPLIQRPEMLEGATYKIKPPNSHAFYVTINDILIDGRRRPFEIFINSKNMKNFAWVVALTRVISAVFRREGDVTFLVEELRSIFDPQGGYFKPGGKRMPSLVAEIGDCLEKHLIKIGVVVSSQNTTAHDARSPA